MSCYYSFVNFIDIPGCLSPPHIQISTYPSSYRNINKIVLCTSVGWNWLSDKVKLWKHFWKRQIGWLIICFDHINKIKWTLSVCPDNKHTYLCMPTKQTGETKLKAHRGENIKLNPILKILKPFTKKLY